VRGFQLFFEKPISHFLGGRSVHATTASKLSEDAPEPARRAFELREHILDFQRAIGAPERCGVPVICAIHGFAVGLAIDLALACDVRLAATDATFSIKVCRQFLC
jgi:Delta3,5-Delta2,4-dienoyl-CoA isomerase